MNNEEIKSRIFKIIREEEDRYKKPSINETDDFINEIIAHIFANSIKNVAHDKETLAVTVKSKDLILFCTMLISYFSLLGEYSSPLMDNISFADTLNNVFKFIENNNIKEGISYLNKKKSDLKLESFFNEHQDKVSHA